MELRRALEDEEDLRILYVMAGGQVNAKTRRFIAEMGLADRVTFAQDPDSAAIDRLGLRLEEPEPIEAGVPHPTTYLLDAEGVVRLADVRRDYHLWLDPALVREALAELRVSGAR